MKESREIIRRVPAEGGEIERGFDPQIIPTTGRYPGYGEAYASEGLQLFEYWRAIRKRRWHS